MAAPKATRSLPHDSLRKKLDRLAEQIVGDALKDAGLQLSHKIAVLKVAGTFWAASRKGEDPGRGDSAWDGYAAAMFSVANGKDQDAEENEPAGRA